MIKRTPVLTLARHANPVSYYEGGHYELNMSFDGLREKQWQNVLEAIWSYPRLNGPLAERFYPGGEVAAHTDIQSPPPTVTLTQHGQMQIGDAVVGCDVQATHSLFECVSVMVPVAMFADLIPAYDMRQDYPELQSLDEMFYEIALLVYDIAPFKIAAVGYERECQLPLELRSDSQLRDAFFSTGNFLATDDVLQTLAADPSPYKQVRGNLRWLPSGNAS